METKGSRLTFVDAGVLNAGRKDPLERRLADISAAFRVVVERFRPAEAAVEDIFVKLNPRSALAIGHARGALLSVLGGCGVAVHSHPPASVKRSVAGNGRAGKEQVARMVGVILGLQPGLALDATDALAVAIAHALGLKTRQLVAEDGTG